MAAKKYTKEDAIKYCFEQVKPSIIGLDDYNKFRQYKSRYEKGTLNETAIKSMFDRFGVEDHCYYTIDKKKKK